MTMPVDLKRARVNAGFTQRGLAKHLDIDRDAIRRLESGLRVNPASAKRVADFFGVQVTDLMPIDNGDHDPTPIAA